MVPRLVSSSFNNRSKGGQWWLTLWMAGNQKSPKERTQGAITKHVVIAREFMGTKLICQKTLFTWIIWGGVEEEREKGEKILFPWPWRWEGILALRKENCPSLSHQHVNSGEKLQGMKLFCTSLKASLTLKTEFGLKGEVWASSCAVLLFLIF